MPIRYSYRKLFAREQEELQRVLEQLDEVFCETLCLVYGFRPSDGSRRHTVVSLQEEGGIAARDG